VTESAAHAPRPEEPNHLQHRPLFVVLSGPSAAGKDAVLDELARRGQKFHRVVTCTTRPRREAETEGVDYHFVSEEGFEGLLASGGLLEHAIVYGYHYGVPKQQVVDYLARGMDVYVRTDVQGASTIRRLMPEAVLVFIAPASLEELEERIRTRGADDEAAVDRRLATARAEMARQGEFEYVIVNEQGRLDAAADRLEEILSAERARV
jgi:guanylate kinase